MMLKNVRIKHSWFCFLLLCSTTLFAIHSQAQNVSASVDRKNVTTEETLTLKIRQQGPHDTPRPDLTNLEKNFEIVSNTGTKQYRNINGREESWIEWNIVIIPKKAGTLLIPSFESRGEFTTPIEINVENASQTNLSSGQVNDIFVESEVDSGSVYVQQQILYTIRLGTSLPISNPGMQDISLENTKVELVSEQRYQRRIGNKEFAFLEWVYAIYPQQSGRLVIPRQVFDVSIGSRSPFFGHSRRSNLRRLVADPQSIEVKPRPASYTGNTWLPAKQITLTDSWGTDISSVKLGEPITRSIIVSVDGLSSSQLPELSIQYPDAINQYPEPIKDDEDKSENGILTTLSQSQAIVATQPGTFTLPEVKVTWWNTEDDQQETAILPSKTMTVIGDVVNDNTTNNDLPQNNPVALDSNTNAEQLLPETQTSSNNIWLIASNVITALIALFFALLWFTRYKPSHANTASTAQPEKQTPSAKQALAQFVMITKTGNIESIRNGLITWTKAKWSHGPYNLARIRHLLIDDDAKRVLDDLDKSLFSDAEIKINSFEPLIQELERLSKQEQQSKNQVALEPLNNI